MGTRIEDNEKRFFIFTNSSVLKSYDDSALLNICLEKQHTQ